jgi:Polyketide cyclase / dehydrase and lipid transport
VREHRYSFEIPHSAARIWALFQDYDRWTEYAPMVKRVDVLWPGDEHQNGRLRRVFYQMPDGPTGASLELVKDVTPERGHTYVMISRDGNDHVGHVRLEPLAPNRTMLYFDEEAEMDPTSTRSSTSTTRTTCAPRRNTSPTTRSIARTSSLPRAELRALPVRLGVDDHGCRSGCAGSTSKLLNSSR